jgi:hypothetical protein
MKWQYDYLCDEMSHFCERSANDLMTVIPLCFVNHFRKNIFDSQYISVLCYSNIVSANLQNIFGNNRFFSIDLPDTGTDIFADISCAVKQYSIQVRQQKILKYIPTNLASENKRFSAAFIEFYQKLNINI